MSKPFVGNKPAVADRLGLACGGRLPLVIFAAFYSSTSVAVLAIAVASWALFWGTLSAAILAIWRTPNLHSLWLGFAGPIGPLIAIGLGVTRRQPAPDDIIDVGPPPTTGPRAVP